MRTPEELLQAERELDAKLQALEAGLQQAELESGGELLEAHRNGGDGSELIRRSIEAKTEIEATQRAIDATREQRAQAVKSRWNEQAAKMRRTAQAKRGKVGQMRSKTNELLRQLQQQEHCDYAPKMKLVGVGCIEAEKLPRSAQILAEAEALEAEAQELEQRPPPLDGFAVTEGTLEALADALYADPSRVGPPAHVLRAWVLPGLEKANLARERRYELREFTPWVFVAWKTGKIDEQASWTDLCEPARTRDLRENPPKSFPRRANTIAA